MKKVKIAPVLSIVLGIIILITLIVSSYSKRKDAKQNNIVFIHKEKMVTSENGKEIIQSSVEYHNGESSGGNAYYSYHIDLAPFPTEKMEQEVKEYINRELFEFSKNASIDNEPGSEFFVKNDIEIIGTATSSPTINSYVLEMYEYTGGAHGSHIYAVFNYDKKTGKKLTLDDILTSPDALNTLHDIAAEQLSKKGIDYDDAGIAPKKENWQLWYADGENIVFIFPPYAVAPYAYGRQDIVVSVEKHPWLFKEWVRGK